MNLLEIYAKNKLNYVNLQCGSGKKKTIDKSKGACRFRNGTYYSAYCPQQKYLAQCKNSKKDVNTKLPSERIIENETHTCIALDKYINAFYILYNYHDRDAKAIYDTLKGSYMYANALKEYNKDTIIDRIILFMYPRVYKIKNSDKLDVEYEHVHARILTGTPEDDTEIMTQQEGKINVMESKIPKERVARLTMPYNYEYYHPKAKNIVTSLISGNPWIEIFSDRERKDPKIGEYVTKNQVEWNDQLSSIEDLFAAIGINKNDLTLNYGKYSGTKIQIVYQNNKPSMMMADVALDVPTYMFLK